MTRDVAAGGEVGGVATNDKPDSVRFDGAEGVEKFSDECDGPGEPLVGPRRTRESLCRRGEGERERDAYDAGARDGDTEVADSARRLCLLVRSDGETDLDNSRLGGVAAEQQSNDSATLATAIKDITPRKSVGLIMMIQPREMNKF